MIILELSENKENKMFNFFKKKNKMLVWDSGLNRPIKDDGVNFDEYWSLSNPTDQDLIAFGKLWTCKEYTHRSHCCSPVGIDEKNDFLGFYYYKAKVRNPKFKFIVQVDMGGARFNFLVRDSVDMVDVMAKYLPVSEHWRINRDDLKKVNDIEESESFGDDFESTLIEATYCSQNKGYPEVTAFLKNYIKPMSRESLFYLWNGLYEDDSKTSIPKFVNQLKKIVGKIPNKQSK